jgi:hypothetical protein
MGQGSGAKMGLLLSIISFLPFIANDFSGPWHGWRRGIYRR